MDDLAVSPCSNPEMALDDVLSAYAAAGYRKFEAFTSWTKSALDCHADPGPYLDAACRHGMTFSSMHLPPVKDDLDASLGEALCAARFAARIGAAVVLFKATSRENYVRAAAAFLDGIEGLPLTPVLQNHAGTPISTLDDFRAVLEGIADGRMKALLEVGHFHTVGVGWREGADLLGDRTALIHVKDQIGRQSVPFGAGEIDLPGLFAHMRGRAYSGDYVVEMEVEDRENTLRYLADARQYIDRHCRGG